MKLYQVIALACCAALSCNALGMSSLKPLEQRKLVRSHLTRMVEVQPMGLNKLSADLCPTCVSFTEEVLEILEDIVLNIGVIDSCGVLCSILAQKTGSQAIGAVCSILCDIAGIREFIKDITKADLDPIYFCELVKSCPIFDNGDAKITELFVNPETGPQGQRTIGFTFVSANGTGTGEININITTVDGMPLSTSFFSEQQPAGTYPAAIKLQAQKADDCHPDQSPCETWKKGTYSVTVSVCNGECFSHHPHSKVYDRKTVQFKITGPA